ncbi:TRAP transporter substrate-binding protein [Phytohabitans sp. LJ34]|uniref:TRAP transporter substrate-binding protein n=1 Tax=Phytohabitans sp. LJ34 TaxID=3452217 RepID=UPI003F8B00EB
MDAYLVRARVLVCLALAVGVGAGAACDGAGVVDKTGGDVVVLRFGTIDTLNPNGQIVAPEVFVAAVSRLSGGQMRISVVDHYGDGAAAAESEMVAALARGELDGGFPASRAFSHAGLRGLEPIEAPFTVTTYAAQRALVTGPAAGRLLSTLDGSGVVGLGLAVGPLRRPWSTTAALTDIRRWRGVPVRAFNSPVQQAAYRALGAVPVQASYTFPELVRAGTLRAVETDVAQYARNSYGRLLPALAGNVVLWPRMPVITMSRARHDALTGRQREWLRAAAEEAVEASATHPYDDSAIARRLCGQGVRVATASPRQLAEMRQAMRPVIDALARDPATAPSLADVLSVAAAAPEPLDVPADCRM